MNARALKDAYSAAGVRPEDLTPEDAVRARLDVTPLVEKLDQAWQAYALWPGLLRIFWRLALPYLAVGVVIVGCAPLVPALITDLVDDAAPDKAAVLTIVMIVATAARFAGTALVRFLVYRIDLTVQQVLFRRLLRADEAWVRNQQKATTTLLLEYAQIMGQTAFAAELVVNLALLLALTTLLLVVHGWTGVAVLAVVCAGVALASRLVEATSRLAKRYVDADHRRSSLIDVTARRWQAVRRARLESAVQTDLEHTRSTQLAALAKWAQRAAANATADTGLTGIVVCSAALLALLLNSSVATGEAIGLLVLVRMMTVTIADSLSTYESLSFTRRIGHDIADLVTHTQEPTAAHRAVALPPGRRVAVAGPPAAVDAWLLSVMDSRDGSGHVWVGRGQAAFDGPLGENVVLWSRPVARPRYDDSLARSLMVALGLNDSATVDTERETLSDGELARLSLARALYVDPSLLMLDDIFAPLDPASAAAVAANVLRDGPPVLLRTTRPEPLPWVDGVLLVHEGGTSYVARERFQARAADLQEAMGDLAEHLERRPADSEARTHGDHTAGGSYAFPPGFVAAPATSFDRQTDAKPSVGVWRTARALWSLPSIAVLLTLTTAGAVAELGVAQVVERGVDTWASFAVLAAVVMVGLIGVFAATLLPLVLGWRSTERIHQALVGALLSGSLVGRHKVVSARMGRDFFALELRVPHALSGFVSGWISMAIALVAIVTAGPITLIPLAALLVLGARQFSQGRAALTEATQLSAACRVPLLTFGSRCVGVRGLHRSAPIRAGLINRFQQLGAIRAAAIARSSFVQLRTMLGVELLGLAVLVIAVWGTTLGGSAVGLGTGVVIYAAYVFSQQVALQVEKLQSMNATLLGVSRVSELMPGRSVSDPFPRQLDTPKVVAAVDDSPTGGHLVEAMDVVPDIPSAVAPSPISCTLDRGDWQVVTGPTGVGKSSLLRSISGSEPLATGTVLKPSPDRIAMVDSDLPDLPLPTSLACPSPNVREVLAELSRVCGRHQLDLNAPLAELSQADRQLVALARAVTAAPTLLLLDEATSALGAREEAVALELVRDRLPRAAALVVLHREANQDIVGTVPPLRVRPGGSGEHLTPLSNVPVSTL